MESELIRHLRERIAADPRAPLGLGDDAAVLHLAAPGCVVTSDLLTDGVDFQLHEVDLRRVGHKSLAVNLSDLAAMASRPIAAIVSLVLPRSDGLQIAKQLYDGMLPLAERFDVAIAGGDTNSWDGRLVISVTAIGELPPRGPLTRKGAQAGDAILVTGAFGGSILARHIDVEPRVREAMLLHERYQLHAGIDVSDGLALDLSRLCTESGCGAVVELDAVPVHEDARRLAAQKADGRTALDHALGDGEDFELVLAVPLEDAERMLADQPLGIPLTCIGRFVSEPGLWQRDAAGDRRPLEPTGYEHRL
ncbi:MAG: thiamine-phosphate kinase [Pirellulales bacterium]